MQIFFVVSGQMLNQSAGGEFLHVVIQDISGLKVIAKANVVLLLLGL